jgi:uncharacterized Tic20 family protein
MAINHKTQPSPEEKIWVALAHGSVLFFMFGPIVPLVIWSTQRKKSIYAAFQSLQALGYQITCYWLWMVLGPIVMIGFSVIFIFLASFLTRFSNSPDYLAALFPILMPIAIFGLFGLYFLLGFLGGMLCLTGRDFRYPFLGKWLAHFVKYQPTSEESLSEENEDRFIAAMGHATAIITMWGLIIPLIVWLAEKDRSRLIRFQALQAVIYQGIGALTYFGGLLLYMISFFGLMVVSIASEPSAGNGTIPWAGLLFLLPILLFIILFFIVGLIYLALAVWASVRVLRGHNYHYPILGGFLARRMMPDRNELSRVSYEK